MTIQERRDVLFAAQHDQYGLEVVEGQVIRFSYRERFNESCRSSPQFFISNCLWIFDPEAREGDFTEVPFLLRPLQEDFIQELRTAIDRGYDLLTEKSRSMGATYCVLAIFLWYWLFESNATFLIGSLNRDKTDKKDDRSTLFAKLDFMVESLMIDTPWLMPAGYVTDKPTRTYMRMHNPVNNAMITGEAPGTNFGRSGRFKAIFLDEFAAWPFGHSSWTACSLTARCHLPVSTPRGMANQFGKLANPKKGKGIRKIRLYWQDDPTKTVWRRNNDPEKPWYRGEEFENELIQPWLEFWKSYFDYDPTMLAQEIEIDYSRSVEGQIYANFHLARRGVYEYTPDFPLYSTWDFGIRDYCSIIWIQYNYISNLHHVIDSFQTNGKPIEWFVPFIFGKDLALGDKYGGYTRDELEIIHRHEDWEYADHFGDPSGVRLEMTSARSITAILNDHGILVHTNAKMNNFNDRITMTRMLIPRLCIDEDKNPEFVEAMENYHWSVQPEGSQASTLPNKPVHDAYSHFATAMEFYATNQRNVKQLAAKKTMKEYESRSLVVFGNQELWDEYIRQKKRGNDISKGLRRRPVDSTGYHRR